jgi:hypothetical protein
MRCADQTHVEEVGRAVYTVRQSFHGERRLPVWVGLDDSPKEPSEIGRQAVMPCNLPFGLFKYLKILRPTSGEWEGSNFIRVDFRGRQSII